MLVYLDARGRRVLVRGRLMRCSLSRLCVRLLYHCTGVDFTGSNLRLDGAVRCLPPPVVLPP